MLYFHQVGVCPPNLDFLAAIDHEAPARLVSIGTSHRRDRLVRAAADRPREIGFGFIQGHWDFSNGERRAASTTDAALMRNEQESPRAPSTRALGLSPNRSR